MKKINFNRIISFIICFCLTLSSLFLFSNHLNDKKAFASDNNDELAYSIFINDPTFSFTYDEKIFFIDNYDNKLKIYDLKDNCFYSDYLDLNAYGKIIDASYFNGYIFAITKIDSYNYLIKINLDIQNLSVSFLKESNNVNNVQISIEYNKIFATNINNLHYIVISSKDTNTMNPLVYTFNEDSNILNHKTSINFDENITANLKNTFEKMLITKSKDSTDFISLIFVSKMGVYGTNLPVIDFEEKDLITLSDTSFSRIIDSSSFDTSQFKDISILNINFTSIDEINYLIISYKKIDINGTISAYTKIYEINISLYGNASIFKIIKTFDTPLSNYLCISSNNINYPSNQNLIHILIDFSTEEIIKPSISISNPNLNVNYLIEDDFKYVQTNKEAPLLSSPWNSTGILNIPMSTDLIIVGKGIIESQKTELEDYVYCLYTFNNKNYLGYVKLDNLSYKEEISLDNEYLNCRVIPKTVVYSLPTKVLGDKITNNLTSSIIGLIEEDSTVEIIDALYNYKSNNSIFLKVKVDNSLIGYIELNQIQNQNNVNYYIKNNASIKSDNTHIYLNADINSTILVTLKKDTRIKINGNRDKKTGFTEVEYCDEYGNLYKGYVLSDHIKTDDWSVMQIIGAILIAINLGILILIVYFRKRRITNKTDENTDNFSLETDSNIDKF